MKLVTDDEIREMDRLVIEQYALPGIILMENAARSIAETIAGEFGPLKGQRVALVCGKGNNGGDGIAVARHLAATYGAEPTIWLAEPMITATPDTSLNLMAARNFGIPVETIADQGWLIANLKASHVVVDAVLGTGVSGTARPAAAAAINAINQCGRPVVSVDVPSGLTDDGKECGEMVQANLTVTLAYPKLGLFLYPGVTYAGKVVVVDIGFPRNANLAEAVKTIALEPSDVAAWLPSRTAGRDSNKGKFGAVALLAGSPGFLGAACLASEAAARTGAGLVTIGVSETIFEAVAARVIDSVMVHPFPASPGGSFAENCADDVLSFIKKRDSVGFGPGIGTGEGVRAFARTLISKCDKPLVIDADALTILSLLPDHGASLVHGRSAPTVLTPHPGEMARLLGTDTKAIQDDRLTAVRDVAERFGAVVVLKGQASLIASPDGRLAVNTTGNPGMATGGSGDTLTGVVTTLLAQMDDPWEATSAAVFLHGQAGDIAASTIGMAGLLASDIAANLPASIRKCYE